MKHCPKLTERFQHIPLTLQPHPLGHLSCSDNCWGRQAWECINHKQAVLQNLGKATFLYCSSWIREVRLHTATIYWWNRSVLSHHHDHLLVLEKHLNATNSEQSPSAPRFPYRRVGGGCSVPGALAVWGAETVTVIKNVFSQSVACHLLTLNTLASKHGPAPQ